MSSDGSVNLMVIPFHDKVHSGSQPTVDLLVERDIVHLLRQQVEHEIVHCFAKPLPYKYNQAFNML
jgi:hypothetical protein